MISFNLNQSSFISNYKLFTNQNKLKTVYLLGQGWLSKGFIDYIDTNKYYIINISNEKFKDSILLNKLNKINDNKKNDYINCKIDKYYNENILNIDIKNKTILTDKQIYYFNNNYVVCGLGSNINYNIYSNKIINNINNFDKNIKVNIIGINIISTELAFYLSDLGYNIKLIDPLNKNQINKYLSNNYRQKILDLLDKNNIELVIDNDQKKYRTNTIILNNYECNKLTSKFTVNDSLQLYNNKNIFVGGDCINDNSICNAQIAYQQGVFIAKKLNGEIKDDEIFKLNNIILYCGNKNYLVSIKDNYIILPSFIINLYKKIDK